MAVALLALFIALSGTTYAATGGNFILGNPNSATSQTGLTSNNAGKALNITQQSTATGATALGLNVPSGKPPFTVNSGTKVTNLNADKLDGLDSRGLVQGKATVVSNRIVTGTTFGNNTVLVIPGLGQIVGQCGSTHMIMGWENTTGRNVDFWFHNELGSFGDVREPNSTFFMVSRNDPVATIGLGFGNSDEVRRIATVHVFGFQSGDNAPCGFQAQATVWTSQ